jgi:hypothetical protein
MVCFKYTQNFLKGQPSNTTHTFVYKTENGERNAFKRRKVGGEALCTTVVIQ